jgi:hypothetical protein
MDHYIDGVPGQALEFAGIIEITAELYSGAATARMGSEVHAAVTGHTGKA